MGTPCYNVPMMRCKSHRKKTEHNKWLEKVMESDIIRISTGKNEYTKCRK